MDPERAERIHRILSCSEALVHGFNPRREAAWLSNDLTMPQFKALIYVYRYDGATSGQIASGLGVSLSTITGVVDRLVEQGLVARHEDPRDRRITRVIATESGRELVENLLQYRNEVVTTILAQLDADQLKLVETAFQYLLDAVDKLNRKEAVA